MIMRIVVFSIMVVTTAIYFFEGDRDNDKNRTKTSEYYVNTNGIASLYGNIVFTFMTHHSIPGLLSPIRPQRAIKKTLFASVSFVCVAYVVLCTFGMLAFWNAPIDDSDRCGDNSEPCEIMKTYNLNFSSYHLKWIGKFIEAYPLLMLMLFPLVAITLRNNIRDFVRFVGRMRTGHVGDAMTSPFLVRNSATDDENHLEKANTMAIHGRRNWSSSNLMYTAFAIVPGVVIATTLKDVQDITHYTGGIAGIFVMIVTPCLLVLRARRIVRMYGLDAIRNDLASPFAHDGWAYVMLLLAACCFAYTVINIATGD